MIILLFIKLAEADFLLDMLQTPDIMNCFQKCDKDLQGCAQVIFETSESSDICSFLFWETAIPDCPGSDPWTEPATWSAGQPDLFLSFQHPACLKFERENPQLFISLNGLGLHFNKNLIKGGSRFVFLDPDIIPTCLINPDVCNPGFTISFWIKISPGCNSHYGILSSRKYMSDEGPQSYGVQMICVSDNTLRFTVYGTSQYVRTTSIVSYQEGTWFKYTAVYTNSWQISSYFDSQSVGSQHGNAYTIDQLPNDGVFLIGKKGINRHYGYGPFQLDSFFVIEQVLSQNLIQLI